MVMQQRLFTVLKTIFRNGKLLKINKIVMLFYILIVGRPAPCRTVGGTGAVSLGQDSYSLQTSSSLSSPEKLLIYILYIELAVKGSVLQNFRPLVNGSKLN